MATFSSTFGFPTAQASLDFVDIELTRDAPLYIDPYAIQIRQDEWSDSCGDSIRSFFQQIMDALRADEAERSKHLLSHLHEPNETHLGQSIGIPSGRGVGEFKAEQLAGALVRSRAFQTGLLHDISEAELFIRGVGRDTISDLTTNLVRGQLAEYTTAQCILHGVPVSAVGNIGPIWNPVLADWESQILQLPVHEGRPILLVPKFSVRQNLSLDSQEFWNHHMIEFLRREYLNAGGALVRTFKNGTRHVSKKDVKGRHPLIKDDLADFVRGHPQVLEAYKNIKGAQGPLSNGDISAEFDEQAFAASLREHLPTIGQGNQSASAYHALMLGVCTFLFYPSLIYPVKEQEIHEGRKRIDIKFTNAGERGFFHSMLASPRTRANSVFIECKNYTKRLDNPELDQLAGRFGHQRGFFGMLLCRHMDDRARIVARCRDAANDGRGFMLVLQDTDVDAMLAFIQAGHRTRLDRYLSERFDEIVL